MFSKHFNPKFLTKHYALVPLFGAVGFGMVLSGGYTIRLALQNPDVSWRRKSTRSRGSTGLTRTGTRNATSCTRGPLTQKSSKPSTELPPSPRTALPLRNGGLSTRPRWPPNRAPMVTIIRSHRHMNRNHEYLWLCVRRWSNRLRNVTFAGSWVVFPISRIVCLCYE